MKKITSVLCLLAMALMLTACGKKETLIVDTAGLAKDLLASVTSDQLAETSAEMLPGVYFYDEANVASAVAYASSGATACEVAVIESKDAGKTSDIEKLFKTHVSDRSELFASYAEGEVSKLDKAIIQSKGTYTVLCVCDDTDKAKEVLKGYGF